MTYQLPAASRFSPLTNVVRTRRFMRLASLSLFSLALGAAEDVPAAGPAREWSGGAPMVEWHGISGDWGGYRTQLADAGISVAGLLTNEFSSVVRTGANDDTDRSGQRSQVNVGVGLDFAAMGLMPKADAFVHYQYAGGDNAANRIGDAQGWSNINVDADISQISELWYQQRFGAIPGGSDGDLLRIKLGKVDANTEFDTLPALALFLNSSAGFSPTIMPLPTYPNPAVSINAFIQPCAQITLGLGYYDGTTTTQGVTTGDHGAASFFAHGIADDKMWIGQIADTWSSGSAQVGFWTLRGELTGFDSGTTTHTSGWYALGQQALWQGADAQSITGIAQLAGADDNFSDYGLHAAIGLWSQGLMPGRSADGAGLYLTDVTFTDATDSTGNRLFAAGHETVGEFVYAFQATCWWLLRADAQYIFHPGGSVDPSAGMVVALRSDITL